MTAAESSATTSPLSSSDLEEMRRLAKAVEEARAVYAKTFPNGGGNYFELLGSAAHDALLEAAEDLRDACSSERILALLEAARRGREDTARLDWLEQFSVTFEAHDATTGTTWLWSPGSTGLRAAVDETRAETAAAGPRDEQTGEPPREKGHRLSCAWLVFPPGFFPCDCDANQPAAARALPAPEREG